MDNNKENQKRNTRLGQGLKAFFGEDKFSEEKSSTEENYIKGNIIQVNLKDIKIADWQPRKNFEEIEDLAKSIEVHGVLQPILLKKLSNDKYELIAGERRFRASQMLNLQTIPAIIKAFSEQEALEISMIENLQRKDLNAMEKAEGFAFLIEKLNLTQELLATRLGISRSIIANFLRMNSLPYVVKQQIRDGKISAGHAKILVNKENVLALAEDIVQNKLSVRGVEKRFQANLTEDTKRKEATHQKSEKVTEKSSEIERFQEMISQKLGVPVRIEHQKHAGVIILEFANLEKLESIISSICLK